MITTHPPGLATRVISATEASRLEECSMASTENTTSKLSSGHGIASSAPRRPRTPFGQVPEQGRRNVHALALRLGNRLPHCPKAPSLATADLQHPVTWPDHREDRLGAAVVHGDV